MIEIKQVTNTDNLITDENVVLKSLVIFMRTYMTFSISVYCIKLSAPRFGICVFIILIYPRQISKKSLLLKFSIHLLKFSYLF